ncbi:MAG: FixH family protein [Hyphomicrobiaceae bacterium]
MTIRPNGPAGGENGFLTGWHVLMMLLAFFGVVFAVNGVFIASALRSYSGVVSVEPYAKGLHYNDRIAAGERQASLGWHATLAVASDGAIALTLVDNAGRPVRGAQLSASVGRPATNRLDRPLTLFETKPGRYTSQAGRLDRGTWLVSVQAASRDGSGEPMYRLRRRVCLEC